MQGNATFLSFLWPMKCNTNRNKNDETKAKKPVGTKGLFKQS